jgi:hypothetical protein
VGKRQGRGKLGEIPGLRLHVVKLEI